MDNSPTQEAYVEPAPVTGGFANAEFAENPEPRCPCLMLLDTSISMNGAPINELNNGLVAFKDELAADALAAKRVEVAIYTFGPAQLRTDFTEAMNFQPPYLSTTGDTPMGAAIEAGLRHLEDRKATYKANGIGYYRPWVFLITDGAPTDNWGNAASLVHTGEQQGKFTFYAVGVKGADMHTLGQIAPPNRAPVMLDGLRFRELFQWLSKSMRSVSTSTPGSQIALPPAGWITVQT